MNILTNETHIWVKLDGRKFLVVFHDEEPRSIKQRKTYAEGTPYSSLYNAPYWHHSAKVGKSWSIPARILKKAKAKLAERVKE